MATKPQGLKGIREKAKGMVPRTPRRAPKLIIPDSVRPPAKKRPKRKPTPLGRLDRRRGAPERYLIG